MTKASELRELDPAELSDRLDGARKELFNLRFQLATGRLDNISRIQVVRREIARLFTLETERESGATVATARPAGSRVTRSAKSAAAVEKTEEP